MHRSHNTLSSARNMYNYQHTFSAPLPHAVPGLPTSIIAVAKNYLGPNEPRACKPRPLLFSKSVNSLVPFTEPINLAGRTDCHYELELALLIGSPLPASLGGSASHGLSEVRAAVAGLGLALDLTLKQPQNEMKKIGGPWEIAKAFDRSCPLSRFVPVEIANGPLWFERDREVKLVINGEVRQLQRTSEMILDPVALLMEITKHFSLLPGDVVLTGTPMEPSENRPLRPGDHLEAEISGVGAISTKVLGEFAREIHLSKL
jgi:2-keto-4-pentenoate hydratase/2-oxohepta-3-ene-1,7-dioic acid hydratase in catechol pathway